MIDNLILIGDIVTLSIDPESRAWGCNPYPDGTVATVIGFGESTWGRVGNCGASPADSGQPAGFLQPARRSQPWNTWTASIRT